ncbi:hypothetical protein DFH09DRAFT_1278510 [Mycena vulgaris]|nr:hypothetical protein DFH09DRAFT_1278510 [Mycena vulgaris]
MSTSATFYKIPLSTSDRFVEEAQALGDTNLCAHEIDTPFFRAKPTHKGNVYYEKFGGIPFDITGRSDQYGYAFASLIHLFLPGVYVNPYRSLRRKLSEVQPAWNTLDILTNASVTAHPELERLTRQRKQQQTSATLSANSFKPLYSRWKPRSLRIWKRRISRAQFYSGPGPAEAGRSKFSNVDCNLHAPPERCVSGPPRLLAVWAGWGYPLVAVPHLSPHLSPGIIAGAVGGALAHSCAPVSPCAPQISAPLVRPFIESWTLPEKRQRDGSRTVLVFDRPVAPGVVESQEAMLLEAASIRLRRDGQSATSSAAQSRLDMHQAGHGEVDVVQQLCEMAERVALVEAQIHVNRLSELAEPPPGYTLGLGL